MIIFAQTEYRINISEHSCSVVCVWFQQTSPKTLKWNSQMKNKMTVFLIHFHRDAALYFDYIFVTLQIAAHCFVRVIHTQHILSIVSIRQSGEWMSVFCVCAPLCACVWVIVYIYEHVFFYIFASLFRIFVCLFVFYGSIFPVHFSTSSSDLMWFSETDCITNNPRQR